MARGCLKYPPAKMNKRAVIQSRTNTTDTQGGYTEAWATDVTVWAHMTPLKGYERFQARQTETPVTHKITIRYRSGVTTAQRITYGGNTYHIKEVLNPDLDN